ncbi:MAG: LemA family protein [Burkholderiaceae bacterium]
MTSGNWWIAIGLAVLGFWMVGAHNRIVGLRAAISEAWAQVDLLLARRDAALISLARLLWERWPSGRATLDALAAAQHQLQTAALAVRARPSRATQVATLQAAEDALGTTVARLLNQVQADESLATVDDVSAQLMALFETGPLLLQARQRFNQAGRAYNEAIQQFPTSLLVPVFRFESAGSF